MATTQEEGAVPDFLRMDQPVSSDPANAKKTGNWHGWPTKDITPITLTDDEGRTVRIRTPVMDLEGLITPTHLHYTVQHFAVPPVVETDTWELKIDGEVKKPLTLNFDQLRRFPGRSVRTVMECSGSDATFFEYFKGEGPKPSRNKEGMILSASEWTGVPLAAVLHEAGLTAKSLYVRAEGNDIGVPATAAEGTKPFYYDKGLPIEKALHPDTILAWAQNGQLLEHLHGAPVRLLVPGWSGNWSVKWLNRLEVMERGARVLVPLPILLLRQLARRSQQRADHHHRCEVDDHPTQRRHRDDVSRRPHGPGVRLERRRRHRPGGRERGRWRNLALRPHRTAARPFHVGPLVVPLGREPKGDIHSDVPGHRRGGPRAVAGAALQQHAQEFQRHCGLHGHGGVSSPTRVALSVRR